MGNRTERIIGLDTPPDVTMRWLAAAGVVGPVLFWIVISLLGFLLSGYSAVSDPISDLGAVNAPYGVVQQVNFVVLGLSIVAFAVGLDRQFRAGWRPWIGVVLVAVLGVLGAIGPGVFPVDRANPEAMTNHLHGLVTTLGFLAGLVGIPLTSWRLARNDGWPRYRSDVTVVGITVLVVGSFVLFLYYGIAAVDIGVGGLAQRLYAAVMSGWVAYHSFTLYRLSAVEDTSSQRGG